MDGRPSRRNKDAFSNFCLRNSGIRGLFQIVEIGQNGMLTRTNAGRLIRFFAHLELEFIIYSGSGVSLLRPLKRLLSCVQFLRT